MDRDLDLRESLRPLARDILPPDLERRQAAIRNAFDPSGGIRPSALRYALPPSWVQWYLAGSLTTGTNKDAEIELPGPARLTAMVVRVKTAPSGTCKLRLTANGGTVIEVTVPIAAQRASAAIPTGVGIRSAGDVLRIDVVNAGSAQHATVLVAYTVTD